MREGEIVLALLPQADGQLKHRPALFYGHCRLLVMLCCVVSVRNWLEKSRVLTRLLRILMLILARVAWWQLLCFGLVF